MIRVVGHRGAAGRAPENTLAGFDTAIELGADIIEFDVRTSSDGVPVVFHDETVDELTGGTGAVNDLTVKELKTLEVQRSEPIPTLDEALLFLKSTDVGTMIEPKEVGLAEQVIENLSTYALEDPVTIVSFDYKMIQEFVNVDVRGLVTVEFATGDPPNETFFTAAEELGCSWISIDMRAATQELVDGAQERGFRVGLFTPNDPDEIEAVLGLNPDYVCSDYPDRVLEQL